MADWNVYPLFRFLQFRDRTVHNLRTDEHGAFIAVIFTSGDTEVHRIASKNDDNHSGHSDNTRKAPILRLRDVIDVCFVSIPVSPITGSNNNSHTSEYKNALLVAREPSLDPFIRLAMFIEHEAGCGWSETSVSVEFVGKLSMKCRSYEVPITTIQGFILCGHGNVIAMCSSDFDAIYVWRITLLRKQLQWVCALTSPIAIDIGANNCIYSMVMTKHALVASDLQCVRISPAPSVCWNGFLTLKTRKIGRLSVITSQLIAGVDHKNRLFMFGVDRKNQNFKAFYVMVSTPLPVSQCASFPIYDAQRSNNGGNNNNNASEPHLEIDGEEKKQDTQPQNDSKNGNNKPVSSEEESLMGWTANKYVLALKTPNYPQLYIVVLDSMFVSKILRARLTKKQVKLTSASSNKIVSTFSNTLQMVPCMPDMLLIPNNQEIHAFLFTFK